MSKSTPLNIIKWMLLFCIAPTLFAIYILGIYGWDLNVPIIYRNADDIWQFALTKMLTENGWVLNNNYLGAPEISTWHHNSAAQTSALHSIIMYSLSWFIEGPIKIQQIYFLINFPLILIASYFASRLLNIDKYIAYSIGAIFSFTTFRINESLYAFLSNYFVVPLAIISVVWIISGRFEFHFEKNTSQRVSIRIQLKSLFLDKFFILGLLFILLIAGSDGYYSFFTLTLLGFSAFVRIVLLGFRELKKLIPALIYISTIFVVVGSLLIPIILYEKSHIEEFYPSGIIDPALVKHPFEAEVYSSSLKMMVAPIRNHRIETVGNYGDKMLKSSDEAKAVKHGRALVPLGTIGSAVLFIAFMLMIRHNFDSSFPFFAIGNGNVRDALLPSLLSLGLFTFLCSISGGVGTLIATIYPTIRGYDRFVLFLQFLLLLTMGHLISNAINKFEIKRFFVIFISVSLTLFGIFDQTPNDSRKINPTATEQFLSERLFVQKIEGLMGDKPMVYQYPYSQYLRSNKYYGWGSFSHIRLYLHSKKIHWSNGAAKNSPVDNWNYRLSKLPISKLIAEIESLGFEGFVIDRKVVGGSDYSSLRDYFAKASYEILEDDASMLSFVRLKKSPIKIKYSKSYKNIDSIEVLDEKFLRGGEYSYLIDRFEFEKIIDENPQIGAGYVISKDQYPRIFLDADLLTRGLGQTPILPLSDMRGRLGCSIEYSNSEKGSEEFFVLTLHNDSVFDWLLGEGTFPIKIGRSVFKENGNLISFDDGFRASSDVIVRHGKSTQIKIPKSSVPLSLKISAEKPIVYEFKLVQDGNAWFNDINCMITIK